MDNLDSNKMFRVCGCFIDWKLKMYFLSILFIMQINPFVKVWAYVKTKTLKK